MAKNVASKDHQKAVFYGIWRKAAATPGGVRVPCETEKAAKLMRFALYNATKSARAGKIEVDQELLDALDKCAATIAEDDPTVVHIRAKLESSMMRSLVAVLGDEIPLEKHTAEEKMLEEAQRRLMKEFGEGSAEPSEAPNPQRPSTKYYTR